MCVCPSSPPLDPAHIVLGEQQNPPHTPNSFKTTHNIYSKNTRKEAFVEYFEYILRVFFKDLSSGPGGSSFSFFFKAFQGSAFESFF